MKRPRVTLTQCMDGIRNLVRNIET